MRAGDLLELAIQPSDLFLEAMDLVDNQRDRLTQHVGQGRVEIGQDGGHPTKYRPRADRNGVPVFGQQSSNRIDPGDTRRLPLCPHPMDGLERLLLDGLHRY